MDRENRRRPEFDEMHRRPDFMSKDNRERTEFIVGENRRRPDFDEMKRKKDFMGRENKGKKDFMDRMDR